MIISHENYIIFEKNTLPDLPEIALDSISFILDSEGIEFISFDGTYLILERSPEYVTVETCDCCSNIRINAQLSVIGRQNRSHKNIQARLEEFITDKRCEVTSFEYGGEHIISLEMIVPCYGYALLNFPATMENFVRELHNFKEAASNLGLEIAPENDFDPVAESK